MNLPNWLLEIDPSDQCWSRSIGIARADLELEVVQIATELGQDLASRKLTVCTAESCTGGAIARALTETAGSSAWFDRAFITYSNQAKMDSLQVPAHLLEAYGAVSEPVAQAMAQATLKLSGCALALSVSGVAGPSGGSAQKPVGTVCFGWALAGQPAGEAYVFTRLVPGDRYEVRLRTACYSLLFGQALCSAVR